MNFKQRKKDYRDDISIEDMVEMFICADNQKVFKRQFVEDLKYKLSQSLSDYKKELGEEYERKINDLYNKIQEEKPPLTFDRSEANWNDGFYKGRLKSMEQVCQEVFGKDGDTLELSLLQKDKEISK